MLKKVFYFMILWGLILAAYSNTFNAAWHLDDYSNIIQNSRLHIFDLSLDSIANAVCIQNEKVTISIFRPVASLTFAINWYIDKDNVFGFHVFNIGVHLFTAFFLFLTTYSLLFTPNLKKEYQQNAFFIAFFTTALWALNPIQTQAVTYIVQRMAALAAMFYILSICFFLKTRMGGSVKEQILYGTGCIVCYLLAFGSKENAAILPIALILIEIVCFQDLSTLQQKKKLIARLCIAGVTVILCILILLILIQKNPFDGVMKLYGMRSFTLTERLLTQFRLLIFYLSQIFYPIPQRFSIDHEVLVSTSLFTPWTTLPSIILVILLVFVGFLLIRKKPLISLAILFYFLNHIIESSILPLELMFEHRNYLPSLFIFLPVSAGITSLLETYRKDNRLIFFVISVFMIFLTSFFASGTYIRNIAWNTENSLWADALEKSPNSARSAYNLANDYFKRINGLDTAMSLYKKSFDLAQEKPPEVKALALNGIAGIYFIRKDYEKAVFYSRKAVEIAPDSEIIRRSLVLTLFESEAFAEASDNLDILLLNNNRNVQFLIQKSIALTKLDKTEESLFYLRRALKLQPENVTILLHMGKTFSLNGNFDKAEWFFQYASRLEPNNIDTLLFLIENSIHKKDDTQLKKNLDQLFNRFTVEYIYNYLQQNTSLKMQAVTVEAKILTPAIKDYLEEIARGFNNQSK